MYEIRFDSLPASAEELRTMLAGKRSDPAFVAAAAVAALCAYPSDREACYAMLDELRGPRPLSPMEKQFIRDRFLDGQDYVPRSYFTGASPENGYTPDIPYTVRLSDSAAPFSEDGYKRFDIRSGGADAPRQVTLRLKPSEGNWYLWEQSLLVGIRKPAQEDPWA